MDEPPREFLKGASPNLVEANSGVGVHAYYDADGTLELVEAFAPCPAAYAGVDLLKPDTASTIAELRQLGVRLRDDHTGGLWFDQHGFALYAPHGVSEGVAAFRRDYQTGG
jgi:hypothetical protein